MRNWLKLVVCCATLLALITIAGAQNARRKARAAKQQQNQQQPANKPKKAQQPATAPSDRVYGVQLTDDNGYHTAPAAAETADGAVHLAWIQYVEGQGDSIVTRAHQRGGGKSAATALHVLSEKPSQFVRPVL